MKIISGIVSVAVCIISLTNAAQAQDRENSRMPKKDWQALAHGVWIASAKTKGNEVEVHVSVPMWGPKSSGVPKPVPPPNGSDKPKVEPATVQPPIEFECSELKAVLKASDLKVYRKDGSLVEAKDLPRLLAKETHVLWGREKIDPYFLAVMRDDVLIVVVELQTVFKARVDQPPTPPPPPPPSKK
jgi:hypothetical protein